MKRNACARLASPAGCPWRTSRGACRSSSSRGFWPARRRWSASIRALPILPPRWHAHRGRLLRLGSRAYWHLRRCTSDQRGRTRPAAECRRRAARVAVRALYTLLLGLVVPLVLVRLWWRGRAEPLYREAVGERFGHYDGDRPDKLLWIHAVSVGEARAAAPL